MNKIKNGFQYFVVGLLILVYFWMFLVHTEQDFVYGILWGIIVILMILGLSVQLKKLYLFNKKLFYFCVFTLLIVPKIIWIYFIPTNPTSDFYLYHAIASSASGTDNWMELFEKGTLGYAPYFTHILHFSLILSKVYHMFGNFYVVGQLFNIILVAVSALLFFVVVNKRFSILISINSMLVYVFFPAYFMYSNLICTEPLFMFLFSLVLWLYQRILEVNHRIWLWGGFLGLTIFFANLIRPLGIPICIAIVIDACIQTTKLKNVLIKLGIPLLIFLGMVLGGQTTLDKYIFKIPISTSSAPYSLNIGANVKSGGKWNEEDANTFYSLSSSYQYDKVNDTLMNSVKDRYKQMWSDKKILFHLNNKIKNFSIEDYGYVGNIMSGAPLLWNHSEQVLMISNGFFNLTLVLNIFGLAYIMVKRTVTKFLFYTMVQLGFVSLFVFVEVQGRYHIVLLYGMALMVSYTLSIIYNYSVDKFNLKNLKRH